MWLFCECHAVAVRPRRLHLCTCLVLAWLLVGMTIGVGVGVGVVDGAVKQLRVLQQESKKVMDTINLDN